MLGEERTGTGVAVSPNQILTAHYLLVGATSVEVVGYDGKPHEVSRQSVDLDSGLGLIEVKDSSLHPARPGSRARAAGTAGVHAHLRRAG